MKRTTFLILLPLLLCVCTFSAYGQNVKIKGKSVNAQNKIVEIYSDADKYSKKELLLDSSKIYDDQNFSLEFSVKAPTLVYLQIENYSQSFFVEPGKDYEIMIHEFNWNIDEKINVYQNQVALPVEFLKLPKNDLNYQIAAFDSTQSAMIMQYQLYLDFRFKKDSKRIDTLISTLEDVFADSEHSYFQTYKRYKIAELKLMFRLESPKAIAEEYFIGQPVLYYDEGYSSLFNIYFANYISKGTKKLSVETLSRWVNEGDIFKYLDSIGIDPVLQHEQLRELVALKALQESYYIAFYNSKMVKKMLERMKNESKFEQHRTIAANMLESFVDEQVEKEKIGFSLPNIDKEMVSLDDFKGKWVYLGFVRVNEPSSLCEIEALAFYRDTVYMSGNIEFVTISCDREFQKLYHFVKNSKNGSKYKWNWLHFNSDYKMLDMFKVRSYPYFVLIDPEGRIVGKSTKKPGEGFFVNSQWFKNDKAEKNKENSFPFDKK